MECADTMRPSKRCESSEGYEDAGRFWITVRPLSTCKKLTVDGTKNTEKISVVNFLVAA